jgi:DNA replication protein DnaC
MKPLRTEWQRKWLDMECTHERVQKIADECERFAGRWFHKNPKHRLLVLAGNSGCGKTHAARRVWLWARSASLKAWEDGFWHPSVPSALYASWAGIVDTFKEGEFGAMEDLCKSSLLVIDDLGAEHDPSKNAVNKLCQVLNHREKLYTLITTNFAPTAWATRFDIRIADRLWRGSIVVDLSTAPSFEK